MNTFDQLLMAQHVQPDRHGEAHTTCPGCGKEARRGQTHFSFSERGGHCFVCGSSWSLAALADLWLGKEFVPPPLPQPAPRPQRAYNWQAQAETIAAQYAQHPGRDYLWNQYKPLDADVIEAHRLGVGVLPASRCDHKRLIVPLVDFGGRVVGFRGRAIDCQCGKWLSPSGNKATLFNWQAVQDGCTAFVTENPIDALMATAAWGIATVATLSVSYWQDEWTEFLRRAALVVVAYDNDAPGNATDPAILQAWRDGHKSDPPQNGIKLVNRLLDAGLPARFYRWKPGTPHKADIGSMM